MMDGYKVIYFKSHMFRAHILAWRHMKGEWPTSMIDHENTNRSDNRFFNLRLADYSLNSLNRREAYASNSTGLLGVSFDKRGYSKPFRAGIEINGKKISLGMYATAEEAHAAYMRAKEPLINSKEPA
jgi:hypothetical protein